MEDDDAVSPMVLFNRITEFKEYCSDPRALAFLDEVAKVHDPSADPNPALALLTAEDSNVILTLGWKSVVLGSVLALLLEFEARDSESQRSVKFLEWVRTCIPYCTEHPFYIRCQMYVPVTTRTYPIRSLCVQTKHR